MRAVTLIAVMLIAAALASLVGLAIAVADSPYANVVLGSTMAVYLLAWILWASFRPRRPQPMGARDRRPAR